eukprot:TRINITY_DN1317_c0_g3_i2.p1 TRINITY_DN1317_c0_g3~~TRINITY_DN1317_c0_g3_i2.p1  ORF type:complete len:215 (+),score=26.44 TRINITY_DN1317_c0_g3_i2:56-646(+)
METLPVEVVELILAACEAKSLALSVPQVSKLFKYLSGDNSTVWKAKCEQKYSSWNSKPSDQTWKQYYFPNRLKLFPYYGFTISKTKRQELIDTPTAVLKVSGNTEYVEYKSQNFWVGNRLFNMLYLTYTDKFSDEWVSQGISWETSWADLKALLKQRVGNYQVTKVPQQSQFQNRDCFAASISTVVKEGEGADAIK